MADCWEILGIRPTSDEHIIRKAFRERIKAVHPDKATRLHAAARTTIAAEVINAYREALASRYDQAEPLGAYHMAPDMAFRTSESLVREMPAGNAYTVVMSAAFLICALLLLSLALSGFLQLAESRYIAIPL